MYSIDTISPFEFTMACIVCIVYISGKLWMYYNHTGESNTKKPKNKGVIRRGGEWEND